MGKFGVNERVFSRTIFVRKCEATFLEQDTATEYENSISGFSSCCHSCWGTRLPNPSVFKISAILLMAPLRFAASVASLREITSGKMLGNKKTPSRRMMWKGQLMARPKREIIPVKTHSLVVRLDDIQYSIIEKYAKQLGISMAEYVRRQATQGKVEISYPIVADIEQLQKLTDEFHAIGNNLNQIARYFNMGGLHSMAIRQEINECVMELMNMRKAVMSMAGDFNGSTQTPIK